MPASSSPTAPAGEAKPPTAKDVPATRNRRIPKGELPRKLLHMSPGLVPFLLWNEDYPDPLDWPAIRLLVLITVGLTAAYLLLAKIVRRTGEKDFYLNSLSYPAIVLAMIALFPGNIEFTCVVVVVIGLGDGSAYFGGKLFGKRPLPWNPKKTWAGLIAFIVVSAPAAALAYRLVAIPTPTVDQFALCAAAGAVAGALAESLPMRLSDNLRVGVAASLAVIAMHLGLAAI